MAEQGVNPQNEFVRELIDLTQHALANNNSLFVLVQYDHEQDKQQFISLIEQLAGNVQIITSLYDPRKHPQHSTSKLYPLLEADARQHVLSVVTSIPIDHQTSQPDADFIQYINLQRDRIAFHQLRFVLFIPSTAMETFIYSAPDLWDFRHQTFWLERTLELGTLWGWQHIDHARAELRLTVKTAEQIQRRQADAQRLVNQSNDPADKAHAYLDLAKWLLNGGEANLVITAGIEGIYSLDGQVITVLAELEAVLGSAYKQLGQFADAIAHCRKSLSVSRQLGNNSLEAQMLDNTAQVYAAFDNDEQALHYFNLALNKTNEQQNTQIEALVIIHIAQLYQRQSEYNTALYFLAKAQTLAQAHQDSALEGWILNIVAHNYYAQNQQDNSIDKLYKALGLLQQAGDTTAQGVICENLAGCYLHKREYDRALQYFNSALVMANNIDNPLQASRVLWQIASIYDLKGDADSYIVKIKQSQGLVELGFVHDLNTLHLSPHPKSTVVLAWRELLRAFALLGSKSIEQIWPQQAAQYCYCFIRAIMLLYRALITDKSMDSATQQMVMKEINAAVVAAQDTAAAVIGKLVTAIFVIGEGELLAGCRLLADSIIFTQPFETDYQWLKVNDIQAVELLALPLWHGDLSEQLVNAQQTLLADLHEMKLEQLAHDISDQWSYKRPVSVGEYYLQSMAEFDVFPKSGFNDDSWSQRYECKVLILGEGGVGKTSLLQSLANSSAGAPVSSETVNNYLSLGLSSHRNLIRDMYVQSKIDHLELMCWDFDNVSLTHGFHRSLMRSYSMYVLVADSRQEHSVEPWLYQIQQASDDCADVLVVTNRFDGMTTGQNRNGLIRKFPRLLNTSSFFDFNCLESNDEGFAAFVNQLAKIGVNSQRQVFKATEKAVTLIEKHSQQQNTIGIDALEALLLGEIDGLTTSDIKALVQKLSELGRIVPVDTLGEQLCINPQWIIDASYRLVSDARIHHCGGIVDLRTIRQILHQTEQHKKDNLARMVVEFMLSQQICAQVQQPERFEKQYFIPGAAPANEPKALGDILSHHELIVLAYELAYFPYGLYARLVTGLLSDKSLIINIQSEVWRDGFIVRSSSGLDCVVVEFQPRQQRIQLTGRSEASSVALAVIIERIDVAMERIVSRQLLGELIYQGARPQNLEFTPFAGEKVCQSDIRPFIESLIESGVNLTIQQTSNDSLGIINHNMRHSVIGVNAINQSNSIHSFNATTEQISTSQKNNIRLSIDEVIKHVMGQGCRAEPLSLLVDIKAAMQNANNQLPVLNNPQGNAVLQLIWQTIKAFDIDINATENGRQALSAVIGRVSKLLLSD